MHINKSALKLSALQASVHLTTQSDVLLTVVHGPGMCQTCLIDSLQFVLDLTLTRWPTYAVLETASGPVAKCA